MTVSAPVVSPDASSGTWSAGSAIAAQKQATRNRRTTVARARRRTDRENETPSADGPPIPDRSRSLLGVASVSVPDPRPLAGVELGGDRVAVVDERRPGDVTAGVGLESLVDRVSVRRGGRFLDADGTSTGGLGAAGLGPDIGSPPPHRIRRCLKKSTERFEPFGAVHVDLDGSIGRYPGPGGGSVAFDHSRLSAGGGTSAHDARRLRGARDGRPVAVARWRGVDEEGRGSDEEGSGKNRERYWKPMRLPRRPVDGSAVPEPPRNSSSICS